MADVYQLTTARFLIARSIHLILYWCTGIFSSFINYHLLLIAPFVNCCYYNLLKHRSVLFCFYTFCVVHFCTMLFLNCSIYLFIDVSLALLSFYFFVGWCFPLNCFYSTLIISEGRPLQKNYVACPLVRIPTS